MQFNLAESFSYELFLGYQGDELAGSFPEGI